MMRRSLPPYGLAKSRPWTPTPNQTHLTDGSAFDDEFGAGGDYCSGSNDRCMGNESTVVLEGRISIDFLFTPHILTTTITSNLTN